MPTSPDRNERPGWLMPALWIVTAAVGTVVGLAVVVFFAAGSESAGVTATMLAAFPLGLLWSGALAALVVQLSGQTRAGVRIGAPLGCGFVGGLGLLVMVALFFLAIFPAL